MYQNRVTLIGFLGKDAEVRTTKSQRSFTVLSLATKRSWKDQTGKLECASPGQQSLCLVPPLWSPLWVESEMFIV